jgi:hypothetical protein
MADLELNPLELDPPVKAAEVVVVEQIATDPIPPNRPRKVYAGMWGPLEIGAVAVAVMVLLASTFVYFFWVMPSNQELVRNRSEAARLEAELISAKAKYGDITDTETQVAKIVASVDDFETRFLPLPTNGQTALYQRLNGLIQAYGLVNTAGPDYAPLETADARSDAQTEEEKGRAKHRSLFPGVYVTTTVEGSYQNLRRFIRELETGREFIVLSAVELAPSDTQKDSTDAKTNVVQVNPSLTSPDGKGFVTNPNVQGISQPAGKPRPQGKTHGETVSLHIEMAAYFRRPNYVPVGQ